MVEKKKSGSRIGVIVFAILVGIGIIAAVNTHKPVITTEDINISTIIPYTSQTQYDANSYIGTDSVSQNGIDGETIATYRITKTDGEETSRDKIAEWTQTEATPKITTYGTKSTYVAPTYDNNSAGCPKNQYVSGYYRKNGKYVSGYWRNSPSDSCS